MTDPTRVTSARENVALTAKNLLEEAAWQLTLLGLDAEVEQVEGVMLTVDGFIDPTERKRVPDWSDK